MSPRQRADRLLVERGLFDSRAKAQAAIAAGLVSANGTTVRKASEEIATDAAIEAQPAHPYVSRGGVKLAAALGHFDFDPKGRICLDVGASTGGFTDVLLARGAARVYAVDVGFAWCHAGREHDCIAVQRRQFLRGHGMVQMQFDIVIVQAVTEITQGLVKFLFTRYAHREI